MSLIKCPECGKEISNQTKKCIHCGYRIKKKSKKIIIGYFLMIAPLIILQGCVYFGRYLQYDSWSGVFSFSNIYEFLRYHLFFVVFIVVALISIRKIIKNRQKVDVNNIDGSNIIINEDNLFVNETNQYNEYKDNQSYRQNINFKLIYFILYLALLFVIVITFYIMSFNKNDQNKAILDVNELKNSVVQVYVYNENDEPISLGSGVVAFEKNIILTNAHVVDDNYKIEVISETNKKYSIDGIIGYNSKRDIAILKVRNANDLQPLKIKNDKVDIGTEVIAIGSPLGIKNTVSTGIVSGELQDDVESYQHTAPMSSGSSGGALLDNDGNLIGITYASFDEGQNLNLAIPVKYFEKEYNIVKNNTSLKTKYYSYLDNQILKTQYGSKLLDFVFNDKYSDEKFKSGRIEAEEYKKGYLYVCRNISKCLMLFSNTDYSEISDYVSSSVNINSGVPQMLGSFNSITGEIDTSTAIAGEGYNVLILKLSDSSKKAINKVNEYLKNYDFDTGVDLEISGNNKYRYRLFCDKYEKCNEVKKILNEMIK